MEEHKLHSDDEDVEMHDEFPMIRATSPRTPELKSATDFEAPRARRNKEHIYRKPGFAERIAKSVVDPSQNAKKKTSKFIPPRYVRQSSPTYTKEDFDNHVIIHRKISDPIQDKKCAANKNYVFRLDAIKHKESGEIWIDLHGLLLGLGYEVARGVLSSAKQVFMESLNHWLHESASDVPTHELCMRLGTKHYVCAKGFSIMVPILHTYEKSNNMVQHVVRHRFKYLKLFYDVELVTSDPPYADDPHNHICHECFLEDLPEQFAQICDCNGFTHLRCRQAHPHNPPPKTEEEKAEFFCTPCLEYVRGDMEKLRARRMRCESGEYEIEAIVGYNTMKDKCFAGHLYPHGAYYVQWKDYPPQSREYIELDESFVEIVKDFWKAQKARDHGGLVFSNTARDHIRAVCGEPVPKKKVTKAKARSKRQPKSKAKPKPRGKKKAPPRKRGKKRSRTYGIEKLIIVEYEVGAVGSKGVKRQRLNEAGDAYVSRYVSNRANALNGTYIPAKLSDVMNPDNIIQCQRFSAVGAEVCREKIEIYKDMLRAKKGKSRRVQQLLKKYYRNRAPRVFLECESKDWDLFAPGNRQQVLEMLERDWEQWPYDTSSPCVQLGEIIDEENPAKKFSDQAIEAHVFGLFASERIPKGKLLMEYVGIVSTCREAEEPLNHILHELDQTTLMELDGPKNVKDICYWGDIANDHMVIDPHKFHNEAVYMNDYRENVEDDPDSVPPPEEYDSDDDGKEREEEKEKKRPPREKNVALLEVNVNGWPHVFAAAIVDIEPGEELLTDYGQAYWFNFREITKRQREIQEIRDSDIAKHAAKIKARNESWERKMSDISDAMAELQMMAKRAGVQVVLSEPTTEREDIDSETQTNVLPVSAKNGLLVMGNKLADCDDDVEMKDVAEIASVDAASPVISQ